MARAQGHHNIAFVCLFLLGRVKECVELLCETDRIPEAAFLTRTYAPSQISHVLKLWKADLAQVSVTAAEALADPVQFPESFADVQWGVKVEQWRDVNSVTLPASAYMQFQGELTRDLIAEMKRGAITVPSEEQVRVRAEKDAILVVTPKSNQLSVSPSSSSAAALSSSPLSPSASASALTSPSRGGSATVSSLTPKSASSAVAPSPNSTSGASSLTPKAGAVPSALASPTRSVSQNSEPKVVQSPKAVEEVRGKGPEKKSVVLEDEFGDLGDDLEGVEGGVDEESLAEIDADLANLKEGDDDWS